MSKRPMPTACQIRQAYFVEGIISWHTADVLFHRCAGGLTLEETAAALGTDRRDVRSTEIAGMRALGF